MKHYVRILLALVFTTSPLALAGLEPEEGAGDTLRVASWNVSLNAFIKEPAVFRALLAWADPDVVLLDEVHPKTDLDVVRDALAALHPGAAMQWTVTRGASGGMQRGVIASRYPQVDAPELSSLMPYPSADRQRLERMESGDPRDRLDVGIAGHGAILETGQGPVLVVVADLRCCGDGPQSRQEDQRRVEARELRERIRQVMARTPVHAVIVAGDFNTVAGPKPLEILAGPYPAPHGALQRANAVHPDGFTNWTWDGRGTPFPSRPLDHQLYGPAILIPGQALVLDTEGASAETLERHGLQVKDSLRMGDHRPIVVEYTLREATPP